MVWRGWGDVGGDPYGIPPALRATSLFKGGLKTPPPWRAPLTEPSPLSLRDISPHCGESPLGEEARANDVRPYIAYRKRIIPRRGEQAACLP